MEERRKISTVRKNIQQYHLQTKNLKRETRRSFEKKFSQNPEFDAYIKSQFEKMVEEKSANPTLIIPSGFKSFVNSKSFKQLLKKLYDYCDAMIESERKFEQSQTQGFGLIDTRALKQQTKSLEQKCRQISYVYMGILLSYGQSQAIFKDQYFFETMMYFISKVLKGNFQQADFLRVDEELNRVFRTDAFNLIKRRNQEDQIYTRYPVLREFKYQSNEASVSHLMKRLSIQKKHHYSMHIRPQKHKRLTKPVDINLSTFNSVRSRSPLVASFYPGYKQKLFGFSQAVRQRRTSSFAKSFRYKQPRQN